MIGPNVIDDCEGMSEEEYWRDMVEADERRKSPPCLECGAETVEDAEHMCLCGGDRDHCHGCDLWPDD